MYSLRFMAGIATAQFDFGAKRSWGLRAMPFDDDVHGWFSFKTDVV